MSALTLTEEECYLAALLMDDSGIDLAEFSWVDEEQPDNCYRLWPFQWPLYRNKSVYQIDWLGRSLGKTQGIIMRACAFIFNYPGAEMLITAPELNHLRPVTDKIEHHLLSHRLTREMLPKQRGNGINHQPQFQAHFINNARLISRLPNRDGRGVKGSVVAGSIVVTAEGLKAIEDVQPGDHVLTHRGRYMPVEHVYSYDADTVTVAGHGHRAMQVSTNHRVLARRNADPQKARNLGQEEWLPVDMIEPRRWHWASPTEFPELELPDLPLGATDGVALLALAGRWVADGNLGMRGDQPVHLAITVKEAEMPAVRQLIRDAGFGFSSRPHDGTAGCYVVYHCALARWLHEHFGHRAEGKTIPTWLLGAPPAARYAFLAGYLAGDGAYDASRERWTAGSASKRLAIGIKLLAQSLGEKTAFTWADPKVTHVMGVELKKPPMRSWRTQICKRGTGLIEHDRLWGVIRSVEDAGEAPVYDLVVAEDHSYVADGLVHLGSSWLPDGTVA